MVFCKEIYVPLVSNNSKKNQTSKQFSYSIVKLYVSYLYYIPHIYAPLYVFRTNKDPIASIVFNCNECHVICRYSPLIVSKDIYKGNKFRNTRFTGLFGDKLKLGV